MQLLEQHSCCHSLFWVLMVNCLLVLSHLLLFIWPQNNGAYLARGKSGNQDIKPFLWSTIIFIILLSVCSLLYNQYLYLHLLFVSFWPDQNHFILSTPPAFISTPPHHFHSFHFFSSNIANPFLFSLFPFPSVVLCFNHYLFYLLWSCAIRGQPLRLSLSV